MTCYRTTSSPAPHTSQSSFAPVPLPTQRSGPTTYPHSALPRGSCLRCGTFGLAQFPPDAVLASGTLPYRESDLRRFDYRNFSGYVRHDFLMVFDYLKGFPDFEKLSLAEKNVFFRYACAVDSMITSAYYTYRLGKKSNCMVMFNGEYVPMEPLPISGLEPGAESLFESESDFNKYRFVPLVVTVSTWTNMCVPFWELHASFEEYALLKALTIWHFMFYKLSPNGRKVCQRQRDAIIQALHQMCAQNNIDPSVRMGSLLLAMSYVMVCPQCMKYQSVAECSLQEQVHTLLYNYTMITLFEMIKCDPVLIQVCSL
ncbi:unnamed protein product [Heligmosomoides polygyrus]|uniref:NR LBD domain-containing protein n=1 Tax=Heligmosomoides polygyrus TaxID=6339 RepID=A0A3P7XXV2_HELPZ|nr:unnamed protein product [Heligmosomoides polygyrus]